MPEDEHLNCLLCGDLILSVEDAYNLKSKHVSSLGDLITHKSCYDGLDEDTQYRLAKELIHASVMLGDGAFDV